MVYITFKSYVSFHVIDCQVMRATSKIKQIHVTYLILRFLKATWTFFQFDVALFWKQRSYMTNINIQNTLFNEGTWTFITDKKRFFQNFSVFPNQDSKKLNINIEFIHGSVLTGIELVVPKISKQRDFTHPLISTTHICDRNLFEQ